jgi:radical SAM protein with 4Fe4S-binding SPASM domain
MISNGYLMDADMVQRAKDLWQLQYVQITLDGTEQTYNRVKAYVNQGVNAFERVLQNIGMLTAAGIRVNIRLNVDNYNIKEMATLVELLHQRFGTDEHLTVYSHVIYGERSPEDNAELFAQRMQLEQQIAQCGYKRTQGLPKAIKTHYCGADDDRSVLIAPDGHLGKCNHYIDCEFFGHIDSEERDEAILRKFKERQADIEACATCPYYPQCILLTMCEIDVGCTPEYQQEHLHDIKESMKYEYERYKML